MIVLHTHLIVLLPLVVVRVVQGSLVAQDMKDSEKPHAHPCHDDTTKKTTAPHIVMVIMDDLGSHDLGMHGTGISTPTCDTLASEGVYLDNYYVLSSCSPTRSAIMTGRYALHTGMNDVIFPESNIGVGLDEEFLPQVLQRAGYATHAVGKWHLGHSSWHQTPTFRGFDSFFGFYAGMEEYFTHRDVFPRDGGQFAYDFRRDTQPYCGVDCSQVLTDDHIVGNYSAFLFAQEAIDVLRRHHRDETKGQDPLFLYLAFQSVHYPTEVPSAYSDMYKNRTDWSYLRQRYAGMLTAADEALGHVVRTLQELNMWKDTLLVFSTDNGGPTEACYVQGSSNGSKRGGKCTVWEGGTTGDGFLAGPALARLGISRPETESGRFQRLFHCVDWLPTLAAVVGAEPSGRLPLDGVNQLPSLAAIGSSAVPPAREGVYIGVSDKKLGGKKFGPALRYKNWKLIQGNSGGELPNTTIDDDSPFLLFDLSTDPGEEMNMAECYPQVLTS